VGTDGAEAGLQRYYGSEFDEAVRLTSRSAQGRLEFDRTQELIGERIGPGSIVLDVGGAAGVHAVPLLAAGHSVTVIDLVPRHVEAALAAGLAARVGDARALDVGADTVDVTLLLGPLYHLRSLEDRLAALREARRVTRPGGWVFAAAISRYAALGGAVLGRPIPHPLPGSWVALLERGDISPALSRFPGGHAHTAEELADEFATAGLGAAEVHAVEGAAGLALESLPFVDEATHAAAVRLARFVAQEPGVRDVSNHLMAIARVPE
jgi:SAM-dependent methyltransferase